MADVTWEQRGGQAAAILTAAAPLSKGMELCPALLLPGSPWESVFAEWGPSCTDAVATAGEHRCCHLQPKPTFQPYMHIMPTWRCQHLRETISTC